MALQYIPPQNIKLSTYKRTKNPIKKIAYLFGLSEGKQRYIDYKDNLIGMLDMVSGLEYHYKRMLVCERAALRNRNQLEAMKKGDDIQYYRTDYGWGKFEFAAYMTIIGRIYYFFTSEWFKEVLKELNIAKSIPSVLALLPFRNKIVTHRQQDAP